MYDSCDKEGDMFRFSTLSGGAAADAIAAARVRELLIGAQQPLIGWLGQDWCWRIVVSMVRNLSGKHTTDELLLWLSESENIQAVFRRARAFIAGDVDAPEPTLDLYYENGDRIRTALLQSINQVIRWIEDECNTPQLLSVLREIGETVDMSVVVRRLERDASSGYQLAQQAFQSIRLLMPGGRPNSGLDGLAGLAARFSLM